MSHDAGWVQLGQLPPGALFETEDGRKGAKTTWGHDTGNPIRGWVDFADGGLCYDGHTMRVRPLPPPGEAPSPLTEEERELAVRELEQIMLDARLVGLHVGGSPAFALLERLLWLLGLTPDERGLVRALAERPTDTTAIAALSDLLKEKGCEAEGEALAEGWRERFMMLADDYAEALRAQGAAREKHGGGSVASTLAVEDGYGKRAALCKLIGLKP